VAHCNAAPRIAKQDVAEDSFTERNRQATIAIASADARGLTANWPKTESSPLPFPRTTI